jgi:hypothetical protein
VIRIGVGAMMLAMIAGDAMAAPTATGPEAGGVVGALWRDALDQLEQASAARVPVLTPPVAKPVRWKARRVLAIDFGAPLLALAAADLDGDRTDELIAMTDRELIVLAASGNGLQERTRVAMPAEVPTVRSRDPVGVIAVVDREATSAGDEVLARASTVGRGARYAWRDQRLVEVAPIVGFPMCVDREVELVAGRNYASVDGAEVWTIRCRRGVVDAVGHPMTAVAAVSVAGAVEIVVETRCSPSPANCRPRWTASKDGVGATVDVDDVDRDGGLEVLVSGGGAPGQPDAVAVYAITAAGFGKKPIFRRSFSGGVVGLAVGDVDGDGDREAFAAVRLIGGRKVDLWLLD